MGGWVLQEEDGKTISVHATDGEKTTGFGQDSEALARDEKQRAERRLEARRTGRGEILTMIPPSSLWMCLPPLCRRSLNPKTLI